MDRDAKSGLTPWEFAFELQKRYGVSDSSMTTDVCDVLAVNILGALPHNQRSILEQYPIIVLPTREVNAMCIAGPSEGAVIAIDYGLMSFLNVLNKTVLCRFNRYGMEPTLGLSEAANKIQEAMDHFFGAYGDAPRWPVSPKRMLIASALSNVQVAFVVGHELGHVISGHLGKKAVAPVVESKAFSEPVYSFEKLYDQEFAADRESAKLVLNHFAKVYDPLFGPNEPSYSQAGVDIFFTYLDMIESVLNLENVSKTHPPCNQRRAKLREAMWENIPEPSRQLAETFESIIGAIRPLLREPQIDKGEHA